MTDYPTGMQGPATHGFAITPHATNALSVTPRRIRADAAGTITFRLKDSPADITLTFAAGEYFYGLVTHVRVTGTTATPIHGFA